MGNLHRCWRKAWVREAAMSEGTDLIEAMRRGDITLEELALAGPVP